MRLLSPSAALCCIAAFVVLCLMNSFGACTLRGPFVNRQPEAVDLSVACETKYPGRVSDPGDTGVVKYNLRMENYSVGKHNEILKLTVGRETILCVCFCT